jgi:basic membrane protein A
MKNSISWRKVFVLVFVSVAMLVAGSVYSVQGAEKFRVALMYHSPIGDFGFTYQKEQGRKYLASKMPDIETTKIENAGFGADAERILTQLAKEGYDVIVTIGDVQTQALRVAAEYPNLVILLANGSVTAPNVGSYWGLEHLAAYVGGIAAGKMTKTNTLGYVLTFPIPQAFRHVNGFTRGAQSVNPSVKVRIIWINTWYDPAAEKAAADSLFDIGADVVHTESDSPAIHQAAGAKNLFSLCRNSDMTKFAPNAVIGGSKYNWGPYFVKAVTEIRNGTWKPSIYWAPLSEGIVEMVYGKPLSPEVRAQMGQTWQDLVDQKLDIFQGPIENQTGEVRVPAGSTLTDGDLRQIDWFVKGVIGVVPK